MAYQTIEKLVSDVRAVHRRLRDATRRARMRAKDERAALLLNVIDEHESALERAIETAKQGGDDTVLGTWLQFEPTAELEGAVRQSESFSSLEADELITRVLETENALMRLYEILQGSTSSPRVQAFFLGLLAIEDSAARRAARVKLEAKDV